MKPAQFEKLFEFKMEHNFAPTVIAEGNHFHEKGKVMYKTMILSAAIVTALAIPSMAGSGGCDDQDMWTRTATQINGMPAGSEKDAALSDWKLATDSKAANDMIKCDSYIKSAVNHIGKASKD